MVGSGHLAEWTKTASSETIGGRAENDRGAREDIGTLSHVDAYVQ